MRADVDRLAAKPTRPNERTFHVQHPQESHMTIRLRKLHVGEQRKPGDLWVHPEANRLIPLGVRPWWMRLFGYGPLKPDHFDHYRVLP